MSAIKGVEFESRILCQDVRQEKTNKFILIGVYSGNIVVREFPAELRLCFYAEANFKKKGQRELHFKISSPDGELGQLSIGFNIDAVQRRAGLHSPQMGFQCTKAGEIKIEVSDDETIWRPFICRNIEKGEVPGVIPIVSEQLSEQSPNDAEEKAS